ncbi:hypothetical protein [Clostridium thermarum]|uniref:hypothetical protein n=1 Tax=Clostridium thermarum TaxID=1716543 RepID=UPI001A9BAA6A|nr:hypothetical protein [Clostridium thermarum]
MLKMMKHSDTLKLEEILGYDEESAGGIMITEYIALRGDLTILESLMKVKQIGPKTEVIETIFVLNEKSQLVGTADLRDILVAPEEQKLYEIMDENIISVQPEEDQEEVALGVVNGAATGIVTGIILYMKYGNPYLGLIIFCCNDRKSNYSRILCFFNSTIIIKGYGD